MRDKIQPGSYGGLASNSIDLTRHNPESRSSLKIDDLKPKSESRQQEREPIHNKTPSTYSATRPQFP